MQAASTSTRRARKHHRQSLHTLTYVILDEANGGIVRNLNHEGVAIQAVGAVRLHQRLRVRFELRHPRVKIDALGEIVWADTGGQCGVRFVDLSVNTVRQIDEWILGDLLDSIPSRTNSIFGAASDARAETEIEADGLLLSAGARTVIQFQPQTMSEQPVCHDAAVAVSSEKIDPHMSAETPPEMDWLSRPISGRKMAWMLNFLIVVAALLLFSLVFLAVTQDFPQWPLDLEAGVGAVIFVIAFYCLFFRTFGGTSMGVRLARLSESDVGGDHDARASARFR